MSQQKGGLRTKFGHKTQKFGQISVHILWAMGVEGGEPLGVLDLMRFIDHFGGPRGAFGTQVFKKTYMLKGF